jgi:hypothetical protein
MTWDEFEAALAQLPHRPDLVQSSVEYIRELRGPLPDDDPEFVNGNRR